MGKKNFKENFNFVTNIFILFILLFGGFIWADSNGVWTLASDIRPGIFGSDENDGNYIFNDSVLLEKDSYYKGDELNQKYVNSDGDVIDGNLFVNGNVHSNKTYSNEYYMNTQNLDDRYVIEGQVNSIDSTMITDGTIQPSDLSFSVSGGNNGGASVAFFSKPTRPNGGDDVCLAGKSWTGARHGCIAAASNWCIEQGFDGAISCTLGYYTQSAGNCINPSNKAWVHDKDAPGHVNGWYLRTGDSGADDMTVLDVTCISASGAGTTLDLVYGLHSSTQCTDLGGSVETDGADKFCKFNSATCPSGWSEFKNWGTTQAVTCSGSQASYFCGDSISCDGTYTVYCGGSTSCTTPSRSSFLDSSRETCNMIGEYLAGVDVCRTETQTCTASFNSRGCY